MKWIEMWMSLTKGQRRATVVLLCAVIAMCIVQAAVTTRHNQGDDVTERYSVLEQEIADFRQTLDTLPASPTYIRRTSSQEDSTQIQPSKPTKSSTTHKRNTQSPHPAIEEMPRINGAK